MDTRRSVLMGVQVFSFPGSNPVGDIVHSLMVAGLGKAMISVIQGAFTRTAVQQNHNSGPDCIANPARSARAVVAWNPLRET